MTRYILLVGVKTDLIRQINERLQATEPLGFFSSTWNLCCLVHDVKLRSAPNPHTETFEARGRDKVSPKRAFSKAIFATG